MIELIVYSTLGQCIRAIYGLSKFYKNKKYYELSNNRFFLPLVYSGLIGGSVAYYIFSDVTIWAILGAIVLGWFVGKVMDFIGNKIEGE